MAQTKKPESTDLGKWAQFLTDATTSKELYQKAIDADFRAAVDKMSSDDKRTIAEHYKSLNILLTGRMKLDDLDSQQLTVTDIRMDYSPKFDNDFVVLTGTYGDDNRKFTVLSSAVRIVRWAEDNENHLPAKVIFTKKPHADGKTMWHVRDVRDDRQRPSLPWE